MLHTKPINEIEYQDVVDFCDAGTPEGFTVEYKREMPSNDSIAKTVAAFANTYGGLLVIGVDAPAGRPETPFEGIDYDPQAKYEEKVQNVILSHIKEPVFPEICVCEPVGGKTFVVIRVAESHLTPHRVVKNVRVYVRTGQSSTPNEEATWDKIEWLVSRRNKSEELRELLVEEGDRYFRDACKLRGINIEDKSQYFAILSVRVIPLFPQEPLIPFKDLDKIENEITVHSRHGRRFPPHLYESDPIQNGVRKLYVVRDDEKEPAHGKVFKYTHLNSFGLYTFKRDIGDLEEVLVKNGSDSKTKIKRVNFYRISYTLHQFLASALLFYEKLGYWGSIQISVELTNALGVRMPHPLRQQILGEDEELFVPSDHLKWEKVVTFPQLEDGTRDVVVEMIDAIAWSLGVRYFTEERIKKNLEENFGK